MIEFPLPIIGATILIRAMQEQDIELVYNLDADEDVKRYVGGALTRPKEEWIERMRQLSTSQVATLPLIIACKDTGDFVGRAALSSTDFDKQRFEIQVLLARNYWGRRLGREVTELLIGVAFNSIKASSVIAVIHPEHEASLALVKNLGFTYLETKQAERWDKGYYVFELKSAMPEDQSDV